MVEFTESWPTGVYKAVTFSGSPCLQIRGHHFLFMPFYLVPSPVMSTKSITGHFASCQVGNKGLLNVVLFLVIFELCTEFLLLCFSP